MRNTYLRAVADPEEMLRGLHTGGRNFFENHALYFGAKRGYAKRVMQISYSVRHYGNILLLLLLLLLLRCF